jgi:hypothetical protein
MHRRVWPWRHYRRATRAMELSDLANVSLAQATSDQPEESVMGFGRGALLWLLGIPLPIILLLALFWHN